MALLGLLGAFCFPFSDYMSGRDSRAAANFLFYRTSCITIGLKAAAGGSELNPQDIYTDLFECGKMDGGSIR